MIETKGLKNWWDELRKYYKIEDTILRDSEEAFTILVINGNMNVLVGRYCKNSKVGLVFKRG